MSSPKKNKTRNIKDSSKISDMMTLSQFWTFSLASSSYSWEFWTDFIKKMSLWDISRSEAWRDLSSSDLSSTIIYQNKLKIPGCVTSFQQEIYHDQPLPVEFHPEIWQVA
mmetsp:Transcript_19240/g.18925  ORF Transcript_19240/g.18925 Transcript_19240/m.18925 type:complete len:110 (-) Transcript_19240:178-507(-)